MHSPPPRSSSDRPMGALLPDAAAGRPAEWRRFSATLLIAAAALFAGLFGAAVALDPYNTGRFSLVSTRGVPYQGPRTANASRGRDPAFDSAVIGNSHIQLLKPQRLDAALGASFVSLVVPGTGPREQLTMLDYFARRHRTPNVLILGIDGQWCTPSQAPPLAHPFPCWLYGEDDWEYRRGLLRLDTLWRLDPRIRQITTGRKSLAIADGYWDYERDYWLQGRDAPEVARRGLALRTL